VERGGGGDQRTYLGNLFLTGGLKKSLYDYFDYYYLNHVLPSRLIVGASSGAVVEGTAVTVSPVLTRWELGACSWGGGVRATRRGSYNPPPLN
jgi:hypothetical protein